MNASELYKKVYDKHYYPMLYFAMKMIHDLPEAEDIVQRVFSRVMEQGRNFESEEYLKNFLYTVLKNACIDFNRGRRRYRITEVPEDIEDDNSIENKIIQAEVMENIYQLIEKLPPQRKKILHMIYKEGLSIKEVGDILGMDESSIRSAKCQALQTVKKLFKK